MRPRPCVRMSLIFVNKERSFKQSWVMVKPTYFGLVGTNTPLSGGLMGWLLLLSMIKYLYTEQSCMKSCKVSFVMAMTTCLAISSLNHRVRIAIKVHFHPLSVLLLLYNNHRFMLSTTIQDLFDGTRPRTTAFVHYCCPLWYLQSFSFCPAYICAHTYLTAEE